ncbi:hypothetical protein [uncultured Roseobacter sp.]|uniref:hypothetical protein n=1 Tax=uncultured Roseobacter sp. TaxID=114847 RepID=UPI002622BBFA|nr:hypothetical protein [uncultured Roseobacter sp.]
MNPVVILGVVQFVWGLVGRKPPNIDGLLIENQIKILEGISILHQSLETIQVQLNEIEKTLLDLPANIEIYETSAEIRTAILRVDDIYKTLQRKIDAQTTIDFAQLLTDVRTEYDKSIDLLTHAESIIADDNSHNALAYSVISLDSIIYTLASHLLYPDLLYGNIREKTDRIENPIFDSQISVEEFQVSHIDRLIRVYSEADKIVERQLHDIFLKIQPMADSQGMAHTLDSSTDVVDLPKMQDVLVKGYRRYAERLYDDGSSFETNSIQLHHHLVLQVIRPFDLSDISGPSGRFIKLFLYKGAVLFFSNGEFLQFPVSRTSPVWEVTVDRHQEVSDALVNNGITLRNPVFENITGPATIHPEQVPGVLEKIAEFDNNQLTEEYQVERDLVVHAGQAAFYKGTLRYTLQDRAEYLSSLVFQERYNRSRYLKRATTEAGRSFFSGFLKGFHKGYKIVAMFFEVETILDEIKFQSLISSSTSDILSSNHPDFVELRNGHVNSVVFQAVMYVNMEDVKFDEFGEAFHEKKLMIRYVGAGTSVDSAVYLKMVEDGGFFEDELWKDLTEEAGDDAVVLDQAFIDVNQNDFGDDFDVRTEFDHENPVRLAAQKIRLFQSMSKIPSMEGRMRNLIKARNEYENSLLASVSSAERIELMELIRNKEVLAGNLEDSVAKYQDHRRDLAAAQGSQMVSFFLSAASMVANAVEASEQEIKSQQMKDSYDELSAQLGQVKSDISALDASISELNAKVEQLGRTPPTIDKFNVIIYRGSSLHKGLLSPHEL